MDPITMTLIGTSVVAPILGGIMGESSARRSREQAQSAMIEAYNQLASLGLPPDLSGEIIYKQFQSAGLMTPELEKDLGEVHSKMADYQENSFYKQMQQEALQKYKDQARTGLTLEDRLALRDISDETARNLQAEMGAINQDLASRGMMGSGSEISRKLLAAQSGADRESRAGMQVGATASQRALQALGQGADLAGRMGQQDLTRAQATLGAEDAMARFNLENSMARQQRNASVLNQAQQFNLQNLQNIANMNVQQQNQELLRQRQAQADRYNQSLNYYNSLANARTGQANAYQNQANLAASKWAGIGTGLGQAAQTGLNAYMKYNTPEKQSNPQTHDVTPVSIENTPYTNYSYLNKYNEPKDPYQQFGYLNNPYY